MKRGEKKNPKNVSGPSNPPDELAQNRVDGIWFDSLSLSRSAVGKLIFLAPSRPDMQFAIEQLSTQVLNPTTECKRAEEQLIR